MAVAYNHAKHTYIDTDKHELCSECLGEGQVDRDFGNPPRAEMRECADCDGEGCFDALLP